MKTIPGEFQLGALQFRVEIVTQEQMAAISGDSENIPWGLFCPGDGTIYVQKARRGFNKQAQLHAFWHEFFHALFWSLGRMEMYHDEVLVDQCGNLMLQAVQSAKT